MVNFVAVIVVHEIFVLYLVGYLYLDLFESELLVLFGNLFHFHCERLH